MKEGATRTLVYVKNNDLYDRILEVHEDQNHIVRNKIMPLLNEKYVNITQGKKKSKKKGIVAEPKVDVIDFQSSPDGDFKDIMNYQDHLTKFVVLNPLKSKTAQVALNLVHILLTFEAPVILQSDNGREFDASWIEKLKILFPALKIVHGTPRHSQSQGPV
ncbi:hypothetical protein FOCC_FOCC015608 [Frankliniella occidentalis]|nr:hypothetical protein FOCC_FOCC015608 [Frankliniella occidentalis]